MSEKQQRIVFGYNRNPNKHIVPHETQSLAVQFIFMCYADGDSLRKIKQKLEAASIISPQNKAVWSQQTIANILAYEQYTGNDTYPPIIEQDLYERVRARQK